MNKIAVFIGLALLFMCLFTFCVYQYCLLNAHNDVVSMTGNPEEIGIHNFKKAISISCAVLFCVATVICFSITFFEYEHARELKMLKAMRK